MPTVTDILAIKGSQVHCIPGDATVLEATQKMNQQKVGALIVAEGGQILGMFTERDVLTRVVVEQLDPAGVTVDSVMTRQVICVPQDTDLDEVGAIMKEHRIRHVPIVDEEGKLLGMVSIGDLNAFHVTQQAAQIHFLSDYIYGRA